ncbi:TPA: hypothetical protein ACF0SI_002873, partial [Enterococcus hirae]
PKNIRSFPHKKEDIFGIIFQKHLLTFSFFIKTSQSQFLNSRDKLFLSNKKSILKKREEKKQKKRILFLLDKKKLHTKQKCFYPAEPPTQRFSLCLQQ